MSVDQLADITVSPYAYVWNDPVNFADPTGLMGERKGGPGHGPKTIQDCFGGGDNHSLDPLPKHMRTTAIRIAAAGVNSIGNRQFKGNAAAEKIMNNLLINYAGSHNMNLGQMASMQNEIGQFYQGLGLVKGWHEETYEELYGKVIKNLKLNHEGVQYGTVQAIREAENNWGVLGMAGEAAAFIMTEGLMPTIPTKGSRKPNSSAAHYDDMLRAKFKIPDDFIGKPSDKNGGVRYIDPKNKHTEIRIMPGNINSANESQQAPYIKYRVNGAYYDVNGKMIKSGDGGGKISCFSYFYF